MSDLAKIRREGMRWNLINTLNRFRPYTTSEQYVTEVMQAIYPGATMTEVRCQLDYLAGRGLVVLDKQPSGTWFADLTRDGVDIAEYTTDCAAGIARPVKYWSE